MNDPHQPLAGYALDAPSADDRTTFEAHLPTCDDCRGELAEFGPAVSELSVISESAPPPQLRDDVLSAIGRVRQVDPATEPGTKGTESHPRYVAESISPTEDSSSVVPLDHGWQRRRRIARTVTAIVGPAVPETVADPGRERTYQLWTVALRDDDKVFIPDRTFDSAGSPIGLTGDVAAAAALAISLPSRPARSRPARTASTDPSPYGWTRSRAAMLPAPRP